MITFCLMKGDRVSYVKPNGNKVISTIVDFKDSNCVLENGKVINDQYLQIYNDFTDIEVGDEVDYCFHKYNGIEQQGHGTRKVIEVGETCFLVYYECQQPLIFSKSNGACLNSTQIKSAIRHRKIIKQLSNKQLIERLATKDKAIKQLESERDFLLQEIENLKSEIQSLNGQIRLWQGEF